MIAIKNMEMPDNCCECLFGEDWVYCQAMDPNFCGVTNDDERPSWCSLIEIVDTSLETVAEDYDLTPDGVSFALDQYQTVISEITHGMMSKLTYNAKDVLQTAQEKWCNTCELMKAQEPKEVVYDDCHMSVYCPSCENRLAGLTYSGAVALETEETPKYCWICGQAVKW